LSLPVWGMVLATWANQLIISGGIGLISGLITMGVYSDFFATRTVADGPEASTRANGRG